MLEHCRLGVLGHHNSQLNKEGGDWYPVFRSPLQWIPKIRIHVSGFLQREENLPSFKRDAMSMRQIPRLVIEHIFLFLTILSQNSLATVPMAILKKENGSKVGILVGEDRCS